MPSPRTLVEIALQTSAANINSRHVSSLDGVPEELALALFDLVLSKGKLTPRSLALFLQLVEEGKRREQERRDKEDQEEGGDREQGDLFSTTSAASIDGAGDDKTLYSSLAARIADLRIQLPPPVVPLGTGRWLGDVPPPWK